MVLWGLAVVIGGVGLVAPAAIKPVFVAWTVLAFPIGWTVSSSCAACFSVSPQS